MLQSASPKGEGFAMLRKWGRKPFLDNRMLEDLGLFLAGAEFNSIFFNLFLSGGLR